MIKTKYCIKYLLSTLLCVIICAAVTCVSNAFSVAWAKEKTLTVQPIQIMQKEYKPETVKTESMPNKTEHTKEQEKKQPGELFKVTAYDLSVQSCGKPLGHPDYGKAAYNEFPLAGHSWDSARTIAVDPHVIPLGSKVEVTFTDSNFQKYDGIYTARDTGSAIKGNKIDLFLGDFGDNLASQEAINFGVREANVKIIILKKFNE